MDKRGLGSTMRGSEVIPVLPVAPVAPVLPVAPAAPYIAVETVKRDTY